MNLLVNADCFNIMPKIINGRFDISFTSVPYNRKRDDKYNFYKDNVKDYFSFLDKAVSEMLRVSKYNVFLNIQQTYYNKSDVFQLMGKYHDKIVDIFTWTKSNPTPARHGITTNAYEWIIVFGNPLRAKDLNVRNVIQTSVARSVNKSHKGVMNQAISDFFIRNYTQKGYNVFDPFAGLGTTAISCEKYGANFFGCEIVPEYCDLFIERVPNTFKLEYNDKRDDDKDELFQIR